MKLLDSSPGVLGDSGWQTANISIPQEGTYQFVFVAGSYDLSGGRKLGAQLFIDDVSVTNAARKLSGNVIENIGSLLYGEADTGTNSTISLGTTSFSAEKTIGTGQKVNFYGDLGRHELNIKKEKNHGTNI
mgnify:CR=1 FL=1